MKTLSMVLVVETDVDLGNVLVATLASQPGYHPLLVTDGIQAFEVVQHFHPDALILNAHLCNMNGLALSDQLHAFPGLEELPTLVIGTHLPHYEITKRHLTSMGLPIHLPEFLFVMEDLLASVGKFSLV